MTKRPLLKWNPGSRGLTISLLLLIAGSRIGSTATYTVCASGCTFNNANSSGNPVQAAINTAAPGDIIEVRAGEVFTVALTLPAKKGSRYITLRSSRWRELPLPGYRVNPEQHGALMPVLQPIYQIEPVLSAGKEEQQVSSADPVTDTLTIPNHQWATGTPVSCRPDFASTLPDNVEENVIYYVLNTGSNTFKVSKTIGGPPVDIRSPLHTAQTYCTEADPAHHYRFIGIDFQTQPGVVASYSIVSIGSSGESAVLAVPHHIEFERCLIRGFPNDPGPRNLIVLNGAHLRVEDSWLAHAKEYANESHAIAMFNTPGPVALRNNYINAASINILSGGAGPRIRGLVTSDLTIEGNLIEKLPYQLYSSGNGAPSGSCLNGRYYRNVAVTSTSCADGGCYTCQDGSWVQDLLAPYRSTHYLTKGLIEFKLCLRCRIEGNLIRTGFDGPDTGNPGSCLVLAVIGDNYGVNRDVVFRNNRCEDVWSGFGVAVGSPTSQLSRSGPVRIENNLVTGMGRWPQYSIFSPEGSGAQRRVVSFSTGHDNVVFRNNTIRAAGDAHFGILFFNPTGGPIPGFAFENNILPQGAYGIFADGAQDTSCGTTGIGQFIANATGSGRMRNSVMYGPSSTVNYLCATQNFMLPPSVAFVSSTDGRLSSSSPFSASCTSGCAFSGTDGKDLGVDTTVLDEAVSGSLAGTPKWSELAQLKVSAGSTRALIGYMAPTDQACTVELFENAAMTQLYTDTLNSGLQADTRAGNVFDGRRRRFVLGSQGPLVANTLYYGRLTCLDRTIPFQVRTRPPGSEIARFGIQLQDSGAQNAIVEYASDPAMGGAQVTSPAPFSNGSATVSVPVAPGAVVYARWKKLDPSSTVLAAGPVEVYVAP